MIVSDMKITKVGKVENQAMMTWFRTRNIPTVFLV